MDFIQWFVAEKAAELVALVHEAGKEAMMFLGDNWIGTEPYGPYLKASDWTRWWEAWEGARRCG